jgi:hypothetical protein
MSDFELDPDHFKAITEIWRTGPQQVEVSLGITPRRPYGHHVRITARERIRGGATPGYYAGYEEKIVTHDSNAGEQHVWADTEYPMATGDTPEACLRQALGWVSNAGSK